MNPRSAIKTISAQNPSCCIPSLPVRSSAEMMPRAANMAMRPLFSSRFRISVLASEELRRDDAQSREHGHAAVVQLTVPHLRVVHAEAHWVTEIAHLLARVLRPDRELQEAREQEDLTNPPSA